MSEQTVETKLTIAQLANTIGEWEQDAGESFTDYFMHGGVNDKDWGLWLIDNGHKERGEAIVKSYDAHEAACQFCCQDQDFLYAIFTNPEFVEEQNWKGLPSFEVCYSDEDWSYELEDKNHLLWAEFLLSSEIYTAKVTEFLKGD